MERKEESGQERGEGFVLIDVETFAPLLHNHNDLSSNPRFSLPRSISRKGSGRSNDDRKTHYDANSIDKETSIPQSPLKGGGSTMPEKLVAAAVGAPVVGPMDLTATVAATVGPQLHQITITTGANISDQTERRFTFSKKTSFKRSPSSWTLDPKKVVLFFATLSSMGSILLIIFTLWMSNTSPQDSL